MLLTRGDLVGRALRATAIAQAETWSRSLGPRWRHVLILNAGCSRPRACDPGSDAAIAFGARSWTFRLVERGSASIVACRS